MNQKTRTHPSIVVEESGGCDDGQEDDGGPHGFDTLGRPRRPVHHVVPAVQRRVHAERPERFPSLAQPLMGRTETMGRKIGRRNFFLLCRLIFLAF